MLIYFKKSETGRSFLPSEKKMILSVLNDSRSWCPKSWKETKEYAKANWAVQLESQEYIDMLPGMKGLSVTFMNEIPRRTLFSFGNWCTVPSPVAHVYTLQEYRTYLINHEAGHMLGLGHPRKGTKKTPAPIMMQQSRGLYQYTPNTWPLPDEIYNAVRI